jgi:hypothetical protein
VALLVLAPFLVSARLGEFLTLPSVIASVMPVVSANAHNIWHLAFAARGGDPILMLDTASFFGPVTYRSVAAILVLAQFLATYWLYWSRRVGLAEAAALGAVGWFLFTTQAHENHVLFALPLLAVAWPTRYSLIVPFGVLSITVLANMALHDQVLLEVLGAGLNDPRIQSLRSWNAAANVACFATWLTWAVLRRPGLEPTVNLPMSDTSFEDVARDSVSTAPAQ